MSAETTRPAPLDTAERVELLRQMVRIRRFEQRCVRLYSEEKIRGFLHLYIGEEAVAAGLLGALGSEDAVVSTYREHGHALARGMSMTALMAEMFGRSAGCSHGRGGSMHLFDSSRRFYGGNAIVGGGLPMAVGLALADVLSARQRVTVCLFGDGAMAEGIFHECANLAALWRLPVLFACENNQYAMGTALRREHAATDLALRAAGYGMAAWPVDGMDAEAVALASRRAVTSIRAGGGPCFLELRTYRFRAHSLYDADRYRDPAEIAQWKARDPIPRLTDELRAAGALTEADAENIEQAAHDEIEAAITAALEAPAEPVADLTRHVYAEET
ncbi:pyruvate dehydrogenase (acetyl-transferring) E1 component subunit alpha [Nocardia higoensis]|uniref:Pyruvate dehydrogenase E1 component subunit alpha n=1 Tax=Nocardia higoensis TaxID=228599 RepID=A0ABS0D9F1_9NOCA|nr:pyruvate dehydrogenase (acetyl-transferring) E1 component subunit alpha [Nocardia higoensis]MBF6354453.1 pyruvate dehydrogenase (acetyl-transferring) E1 component subunit alpha [Nocardia higoensis]